MAEIIDHNANDAQDADSDSIPGTGLATSDQLLPTQLFLLPVPSRPYFPGQIQPLVIDKEAWGGTLLKIAESDQQLFGLAYIGDADPSEVQPDQFATMGCAVRMHNPSDEQDHLQFIARGLRRFRIRKWLSRSAPFLVEVDYPADPETEAATEVDEVKAYGMAIIDAIKELVPLNPLYGEELKQYLKYFNPNQPSPLADFAAALTSADGDKLQGILQTLPILPRMKAVLPLLLKELEVVRLQAEITEEVNRKVGDHQRDFFLREQLKIIQEELGISKDDRQADLETFRERLEDRALPEQAGRKIEDELHKLSILETGSPEYGVTRNYLDWATSVPWGKASNDKLDIAAARTILDAHHDGLDDVKDRIIEFLALGAFRGAVSGSIILLVGPPGVGKTSIGKSIAEALGRKFYRFSLGGMRDEAEIKGHRRTYIGAMPGKFVQALKDVDVCNPVIMLDEVDKIGASYQGDPASALLEALDPEQNQAFLDHYLDLRIDLSKVLFVCTANQLDSIPGPLLDRMDVIRLSGYIAEEKLAIAKHHLIPRQLQKAGLKKRQLKFHDAALRQIIEGYAREAGVRQLDKTIAKILRKAVVQLLDGSSSVTVRAKDLESYLGMPRFRTEKQLSGTGVVTGLAWTAMGGATLPIEASAMPAKQRSFKQTGQLGDVMRESSEIAYSYVLAKASRYGVDPEFFNQHGIHLHVPEGATPKDGPSAGVTMTTALLSLALGKPPRANLAMTGEITLTGHVLAVGGIREKIIAARRQKIRSVVLPEANRGDYEELPDYLKKGVKVAFADHYDAVAKLALGL